MAVWFTSDHHFGHERIIELADRPFADVVSMNAELVRRWNEVVAPTDEVYHLGDLVMGQFDRNIQIIPHLHGKKYLIPGNHDRTFRYEKPRRRERGAVAYREVGLELLPEHVEYTLGDIRVLLCHFPPSGDSHGEDRFQHLRPHTSLPVIHGHTHSRERTDGTNVHIGVDAWDFRPVHEDEVLALLRAPA